MTSAPAQQQVDQNREFKRPGAITSRPTQPRWLFGIVRSIAGLLPHGGSKVQTEIGALVGAGDKTCELLCPKVEDPKAEEARGFK
jgi:hypothetical protein